LEGKYDLEEGYNLEAAKIVKPVIGDITYHIVFQHLTTLQTVWYLNFITMNFDNCRITDKGKIHGIL